MIDNKLGSFAEFWSLFWDLNIGLKLGENKERPVPFDESPHGLNNESFLNNGEIAPNGDLINDGEINSKLRGVIPVDIWSNDGSGICSSIFGLGKS